MASDLTLYWISGSPPCWRVMFCLEEKKLQGYNSRLLSGEKKEHKSDEVLKLNPRGQVPTFTDGNICINESLAILHYLEDKFKTHGTCLIPSDPAAKAATLQRMHEVQSLVKSIFEDYGIVMWFKKPGSENKELMKERAEKAATELARWEKYLEELGNGSYITGKDLTMADIVFLPTLGLMVRSGLQLDSRPHLKAYYEMGSQLPSFKAAIPPHYAENEGIPFLKDL